VTAAASGAGAGVAATGLVLRGARGLWLRHVRALLACLHTAICPIYMHLSCVQCRWRCSWRHPVVSTGR
jgi:hypothetical protein